MTDEERRRRRAEIKRRYDQSPKGRESNRRYQMELRRRQGAKPHLKYRDPGELQRRHCSHCDTVKPLEEFTKNARGTLGRTYECTPCSKARLKALRQATERTSEVRAKERAQQRTPKALAYQRQRAAERRQSQDYAQRHAAHIAVRNAVRTGRLVRPSACPNCGGSESRIEAHHHKGYAAEHRLDVLWLCAVCHRAADKAA